MELWMHFHFGWPFPLVIEKWQQQIIKLLLRLYTPLDSRRKDIYSTPDHLLHPDPHRILLCGD